VLDEAAFAKINAIPRMVKLFKDAPPRRAFKPAKITQDRTNGREKERQTEREREREGER